MPDAHYLQVDLSNSLSAFSFDFTGRATGGAGNPKAIDIYASTDGTTFEKVSTIAQEIYLQEAAGAYASPGYC